MRAKADALWNAQANNPHYRIRELILPVATSTGVQQFEFKTTFLPHNAGQILVRSQGQERESEIIADRQIEFESGTDCEILNPTDQELRFTVMESK